MTPPLAAEPTEAGSQTLVPGVAPIAAIDRRALRVAAPMCAKKPQRPCDLGLFDLAARDQLDLFQRTDGARRDNPCAVTPAGPSPG